MKKLIFIFSLILLTLLPVSSIANPDTLSLEGKPISDITIEGLKRTKEYIVQRELISRVGDNYHAANIKQEMQNLELLDIFSSIKIVPTVENDSVNIKYVFVETFPVLPSISIKITDENGISAGGGVKSPNLLGRDIFFSGRLVVGGETEAEVWIENPWITGNHLGYKLEYYHRERDNLIGDFYEIANEFYLRVGSNIKKHGRVGGLLEYLRIHSDKEGITLSPDNLDHVTRFGFYLGYDSRNAFSDTRRGWWSEIVASRDFRIFENSTHFYQLDVDLRRYQPLPFWERHILALFSLTTLRTGKVGENVAPWQQFGVGGTNSIRGWEFAARKGKNQFLNTLEYRVTIIRPSLLELPLGINYRGGMQLALFGDFGTGWNKSNQFATKNFIGGGGFGIRLLIPIVGMARLDFAWGQHGKGVFLHLGSFEKPVMSRRRVR